MKGPYAEDSGNTETTVGAIPIYIEELLLQLTCWVECTT